MGRSTHPAVGNLPGVVGAGSTREMPSMKVGRESALVRRFPSFARRADTGVKQSFEALLQSDR